MTLARTPVKTSSDNSTKMVNKEFTAWQILISKAERLTRYVKKNIEDDIQNFKGDECRAEIEELLDRLDKKIVEFKVVTDEMESSEEQERDDDKIEALINAFDTLTFKSRTKLCGILRKMQDALKAKNDDNSSENWHDATGKNREANIEIFASDLEEAQLKLESIEVFIAMCNPNSLPSVGALQHRMTQTSQIELNIDTAVKSLKRLHNAESQVKVDLEDKKRAIDKRIGNVYTFLLDAIDAQKVNERRSSHDITSFRTKLEPIKVPEFHGDPREWISFRDRYVALIHDNREFSKVVKYTYLQLYLKDKNAPASVRTGKPSEAGYDNAWKDVLNKYNHERLIIQHLFDAIMKIKSMSDESSSEMQRVLTEIQSCIDSLRQLESHPDLFGAFIAHIALFRLDKHSRDLYETANKTTIPTWKTVAEFLDDRSKTLCTMESQSKPAFKSQQPLSKQQPHQLQKSSTSNIGKNVKIFHTHTTTLCKMCNDQHWIGHCPKLSSLSPSDLLQKIRSLSLCENCFGAHTISECKNSHTCRECKQRHHTKLHGAFVKPTTTQHAANVFQSYKIQHNQDFLISSYAMLSTSVVVVRSQTGSWIKARALIDSGSTGCFMTKKFAQKLSLTQLPADIEGSSMSCNKIIIKSKVRTIIASNDHKHKYALEFCLQDELTGNIPSVLIPKEDFKIPSQYQSNLADPDFNVPSRVDIVVGNIIAKKIEIGLPIELESGIDLQNTVFGWQIAGGLTPLASSSF